ncbi:MAG: PAS domain-containing protein [Clostridia bacterium]
MLCHSPIAVTQHFIRAHMEARDLAGALSCLTDAIAWFGTGAFEVVRGKDEARRFLAEEIAAFPAGYTVDFVDMTENMLTEDCATVFGCVRATDRVMGSQMDCRVTAACVRCADRFLIASLHMSLPSELQNDSEYYPFTIAKKKIQQLKDSFFDVTLPGGLLCCDADVGFKLRYINDFFVKMLGYSSQDDYCAATGGFFSRSFGVDEEASAIERTVREMQVGEHHTFTYRVRTKAGGELWLRGYTQKYEAGESPGVLCFCMDISDIVQLERTLKEQTRQLEFANAEIQTIIGNIPGGVHRCQLFDRIHVNYVSHGFEEMSGYTRDEIHALFDDNYSKLLIEEDRPGFATEVRHLASGPADQNLTYRMRKKDGTVIRVADHFRSIRMEDGKMWGFGVATDVTEQYETLAQLKLLTDSIPGGLAVYAYSAKGLETVYFSDGVCEMLGYTRDEYARISRNDLMALVFQEDLDRLRQTVDEVVEGEDAVDCVYRVRTKRGSYRWMNLRGTVAERRGDTILVNAVLFDITRTKAAEEQLRIRDEEYSLAIAQSGKVVYRYTLSDKSVYRLQKSADPFDFPAFAQDVPGSVIRMNVIAPQSVDDFIAFYDAIDRGEKSGGATLCRKMKCGDFGWCSAHFTTLFGSTGEPVSAVISIEDVTRQHEQELENEVLRQNEALFQIVVSHSDRYVVKFDIQTRTAYVPPRTADAFSIGAVLHNVPACCVGKGIISEESTQTYIDFYEKMVAGAPAAKAIVKMRRKRKMDQWGWYRFDGSVIFDDKNQPSYAVVSFIEVTQQYEKELAYERMTQHVSRLSQNAMLYFEANLTEMRIENAQGRGLCYIQHNLDAKPGEMLKAAIDEMVAPEDQAAVRDFFDRDSLLADFAEGKTERTLEARVVQGDQSKWARITVEMVADPFTEDVLVYASFQDIDETKTKEIDMRKQAQTDGLTQLYNRTAVEWQIRRALEEGAGAACALAIIDVDDLKAVNDTLGHMQGDRAIRAFADALREFLDARDLIGRVGGDEFLVFVPKAEDELALKGRMCALVDKLALLRAGEDDAYHLHGSIGMAVGHLGEADFETLYKRADIALYYVKRHGKNGCAVYRAGMESEGEPG